MKKFNKIGLYFLFSIQLIAEPTQSTKIEGDNNQLTQVINKGLSAKKVDEFIRPYKDRIETLENKLEISVSLEVKHRLSQKLIVAKQELSVKSREIEELNKFIKNSQGNITKRAIEIYEKKGLKETLAYFKSKEVNDFEEKSLKKIAFNSD